ncbi:hypothetical protein RJ640_005159 [Escallonia rubra]|uniref:Ty3 transposon capsid-like protein domain-containing protein n=1 Tax=Escallonia rubra TaxID=112253 RepID=A0AA88UPQ7_9ASTE|nr:hypothetical protein RJ640_005159 [Escallonia rubra]
MGLKESVSEISELKASVDHLKDELPFMRQSMTKLQHMMQQLLHIREEEGTNSRHTKWSKGNEQLYKEYHQTTSGNSSPKVPKLEFPRFSGEDSYGWVRKVDKFFEFNPVEEQYKVNFASIYFDGQAEFWFGTYIKAKGIVCWQEFTKDLHARFSSLFRESIIGEFHKLRQATTVEQYYNDFETLRSILVSEGSKFAEEYYIQGFISGLKDDIRLEVEKFDVGDLSKAIFLARKQEASLQTSWHNPRIGNKAHLSTPSSPIAKVPFLTSKTSHGVRSPSPCSDMEALAGAPFFPVCPSTPLQASMPHLSPTASPKFPLILLPLAPSLLRLRLELSRRSSRDSLGLLNQLQLGRWLGAYERDWKLAFDDLLDQLHVATTFSKIE